MVQNESLQPPVQPATRDLRPSRRRRSGVLPPYSPASGALISADADQQRRGPVSERFVRESARHSVAYHALAPAVPTPPVRLNDSALDDSAIRRQMLPDSVKSELIEPAERAQIGRDESRLGHVEVFRMGSVRTSILRETSTPIRPATRSGDHTLVREEPLSRLFAFEGVDASVGGEGSRSSRMEVPKLTIRKTSTCSKLPSPRLI